MNNNNNRDYPASNSIECEEMLLEERHVADRHTLIEQLEERQAATRKGKPRARRAA